jgi:poly(hydroxyalkanoate) granule-associated protein
MPTKPKKEPEVVVESEAQEKSALYEPLRKVMLASIGLLALTQEEAEKFIKKLIEKGEIAEQEGKNLMNEMMAKKKPAVEKKEDELNKRIASVVDNLQLATKSDIEGLKQDIAELNKNLGEKKAG